MYRGFTNNTTQAVNFNAGYTWAARCESLQPRARANKELLCCRTAALELALLAAEAAHSGADHEPRSQHHHTEPSPSPHHGDGAGTKHK